MIRVYFDQSPLHTGHSHRGIGAYTRELGAALAQLNDIELVSQTESHDVAHYPYFDLFSPSLPVIQKAPTVVTIHDVIPLEFPEYYRPGKKGRLYHYYQRLALQRAATIITDSEYSKTQIHRLLKVPEKKIFVTLLAPSDQCKPASSDKIAAVKKKFELPEKYILYVGDINYNKNLPQLIKSLKFVDESIHLALVGKNFRQQTIPEWQWIETQIELSSVTDRVHFFPNIDSQETINALYSGALAYVQPSLSEGFGLPVLEAMRCNTPVIASERGSLPEVGGEHALYTEPTAEAIAERITELSGWSAQERSKRIASAFKWSKTFSWKRTAEQTKSVYQAVRARS